MACKIFLSLPNGAKMPALGYGTWQSKDDNFGKAFETALEAGYRHIDTAQAYENEEIIGKVLKKWLDSGKVKRADLFITTKLSSFGMHPDTVEACLKESLRKLQLDYVDLYLIHFPVSVVSKDSDMYGDPDVNYLDVWKKMEEQHDAGRVLNIGISNFNIRQIENILKNGRIKPANNQVEMHIYMQQKELVDFCKKHGITVVAYSPIGSRGSDGFMQAAGKSMEEVPNPLSDKVVVKIAKKHSKTPAQILLRYLVQLGVSAIPKSVTASRLKENINIFDFSLDGDDMSKLRGLDAGADGRIFKGNYFGRAHEHPEYPFPTV